MGITHQRKKDPANPEEPEERWEGQERSYSHPTSEFFQVGFEK